MSPIKKLAAAIAVGVAMLMPSVSQANQTTVGDYTWYWEQSSYWDETTEENVNYAYITGVDPALTGAVTIPASFVATNEVWNPKTYQYEEKVETLPVLEIGGGAFYGQSELTKVVLPDSVKWIGDWAFESCEKLAEVVFPAGLEEVWSGAFYDCLALQDFKLPSNLKSIGSDAFYDTGWWTNEWAKAYDEETGAIKNEFIVKDGWLISCLSTNATLVLPDAVTAIAEEPFCFSDELRQNLRSFSTGDGLKAIPESLFGGYYYTRYDWESGTYLRDFEGYTNLTSVTIGKSVGEIGYGAFKYCTALENLAMPASVTNINGAAFMGCTALKSITFPEEMESIPYNVCFGCKSLTSVTLGTKVTEIGYGAFADCAALKEITLPPEVTYLNWAYGWDEAAQVSRPMGVFTGCTALERVTFEGIWLDEIGSYTFKDCPSLTTIALPKSVSSIGSQAFAGCSNLVSITGGTVSYADSTALDGTKLAKNEFVMIDDYCLVKYNGAGGDVTVPAGVKNSNWCDAFYGATNITSLTIPADVKFSPSTLKSCLWSSRGTLAAINVAEGSLSGYTSVDGIVYNSDKSQLVFCPWAKKGKVTVPETVRSIAYSAFESCEGITEVVLPCGCTSIASRAFAYSGLTAINLPAGLKSISGSVFQSCTNLTEVTLPSELSSISQNAFLWCEKLAKINGGENLASVGYDAFTGTEWLTAQSNQTFVTVGSYLMTYQDLREDQSQPAAVTMPAGIKYMSQDAFGGAWIGSLVIGDDVKEIPAYAFEYQGTLTNVTFGSSVEVIRGGAFYSCRGLESVVLPASLRRLGGLYDDDGAFDNCTSLVSVKLNEGLECIGRYAFFCCSALTSVVIPDSVREIGSRAFAIDEALAAVQIGAGVSVIDSYAFAYCTNLTSVTIPANVRVLTDAFADCENLTVVEGGLGVRQVDDYAFARTPWREAQTNETFVMVGDVLVKYNGKKGGAVVLPANTKAVVWDAFGDENATNVTSVTIPKGLVEDFYAYETGAEEYSWEDRYVSVLDFLDCLENLAAVNVEAGHPQYSSVDGIVYNLRQTAVIYCPPAFKGVAALPSTVLTIGSGAFEGVVGLTGVVFPEKLQRISDDAFWGCTNLTGEIVLPASVTSIGGGAFGLCTGLTSVKLPAELTGLGGDSFYGCTGLTAIDIPEKLTALDSCQFSDCTNLVTVTGGAGLRYVAWGDSPDDDEYDAFGNTPWRAAQTNVDYVVLGSLLVAYQGESTDLVIPAGVKTINEDYVDVYDLTSVVIGKDVQAFPFRSSGLTNITVDAANANWASVDGVLYNKNLTELLKYPVGRKDKSFAIPEGVVKIGYNAFYNATSLESVTIPSTCVEVASYAFEECSGLTSVEIPASVAKLGGYAFGGCENLATVTGGEGLRFVADDAFNETKWARQHAYDEFVVIGSTLVEYSGEATDVVIPEGVKSLAVGAFSETITSITLPASFEQYVSSGDFNGYNGYKRLSAINVAAGNANYVSVDGVLYDVTKQWLICCPQAKTGVLSIPQGVKYVEYAAAQYAQISGVDIPDSIEVIGYSAFFGCRNLKTVTGGAGLQVTEIDEYGYFEPPVDSSSFENTPFLEGDVCCADASFVIVGSCLIGFNGKLPESLVIPEGVTYIADDVFDGLEGTDKVTSLTLPSTLKAIGGNAFYGFSALAKLVVPDSVEYIGTSAFRDCTNLAEITFGKGLVFLSDWAFSFARKLQSVTFATPLERLGEYAFGYCTALTAVNGLSGLDKSDFRVSSAFECTPWQLAKLGSADFQLQILGDYLTGYTGVCPEEVVIPEGVTVIGDGAFAGTRNLKRVTLPSTLEEIASEAFASCDGLAEINLPSFVTYLDEYAFADCSSLATVTGGENLESVGSDVFAGTAFLKNTKGVAYVGVAAVGCNDIAAGAAVDIAAGTKLIASEAFYESKLGAVTFPKTLMDLGWGTFMSCENLKSVVIPQRVEWVEDDTFVGCTALESVQFANPEVSIGLGAFAGCMSIKSFGMIDGIELKGWKVDNGRENWLVFGPEEFHIFLLPGFVESGYYAKPIAELVLFDSESEAVKTPFDGAAAVTYEGFLAVADGDGAGEIAGMITVKAGKAGKSGKTAGISKLTVTIVPFAAKKQTIKGEYNVNTQVVTDKNGLLSGLVLGQQALSGTVAGYKVVAGRNNMKDKNSPDKALAAAFKGKVWTMAFETLPGEDESLDAFAKGLSTFTFTVGASGKVTVSGMLSNGTKVSAKSQLLIGANNIAMPFVYTKKVKKAYQNFGFTLWVDKNGEPLFVSGVTELEGGTFANEVELVDVGALAPLSDGVAKFSVDAKDVPATLPNVLTDFLPTAEMFTVKGKKWTFAKAAKIAFKNGAFDEAGYQKGIASGKTNDSGLKLTYIAKTGAFKGSFKIFGLDAKGKLKKFTMTVNGVVVNGVGYATAVEKKNGSMPAVIRR